jgi:hypothetical protein
MKLLASLFILASFQISAFADQCQWNSNTDARSAYKLVKDNDVIFWCQNCGDRKPSTIFHVDSVVKSKADETGEYSKVVITTKKGEAEIDLAYTYVRTASDMFANVAQLVGCPNEGATTFIKTGPGVRKFAHYYDKEGKIQAVLTSDTEVAWNDFSKNKAMRLPANKK